MKEEYLNINRESWNNRLQAHLESEFYDMDAFMAGKSSLNQIELDLLGDVRDKSLLHLQCHFGQDTLSLNRLGAKTTGIDLSDQAIAKAREINDILGLSAEFICSDVYHLVDNLQGQYDIVYTSYGTINWLPDLDKWAKIVNHFLKPGGKFVFVEFHPVVWMFDDELEKVGYNYFNEAPIIEEESGTYADRDAAINNSYVCWNHSMAEVIQSLVDSGLQLEQMQEYDYAPYNFINHLEEFSPGKFRVKHFGNNLPLVYSLKFNK